MALREGPDGVPEVILPMGGAKLPGIAAGDIGRCACNIIRNKEEYSGKTVGIAGDHLTGEQMADALSRALGRKVRYNGLSPEAYRTLGFPGAAELGNMFRFKRDFEREYCGARDLEAARRLHPGMKSFEGWLKENLDRIPFGERRLKASGE
jgi:uncharacterized protein YbjT (DUF2867 family)